MNETGVANWASPSLDIWAVKLNAIQVVQVRLQCSAKTNNMFHLSYLSSLDPECNVKLTNLFPPTSLESQI